MHVRVVVRGVVGMSVGVMGVVSVGLRVGVRIRRVGMKVVVVVVVGEGLRG